MRRAASGVALVLTAAWLGMPLPAAAADTDTRDKLRNVEQELSAERQRETILSRKRNRLDTDLATLRKGMVEAGARIQQAEDAVTTTEKRLKGLDSLLDEKTAALDARQADIAATLRAMIRVGQRPRAVLVSAPGAVIDVARSAVVMRHVTNGLRDQSQALQRDLIQLANLRGDIVRERRTLDDTLATLSKERGALDILLTRKATLRQRTVSEQSKLNKRLARLSREATDLRSLLEKLDAEAERQRQEEARAPAPAAPADDSGSDTATVTLTPPASAPETAPASPSDTAFALARGRLPLPARGQIITLFGTPNGNGNRSRGITLATRSNATVVAPHDGKVVFAGQFRGYGELLIIAHGEGYHTLLAGMARIYSVVGQRLLSGEPVGLMGEGSEGEPRLYVELRRDGVAINPVPWLAASERKVSG